MWIHMEESVASRIKSDQYSAQGCIVWTIRRIATPKQLPDFLCSTVPRCHKYSTDNGDIN